MLMAVFHPYIFLFHIICHCPFWQ